MWAVWQWGQPENGEYADRGGNTDSEEWRGHAVK